MYYHQINLNGCFKWNWWVNLSCLFCVIAESTKWPHVVSILYYSFWCACTLPVWIWMLACGWCWHALCPLVIHQTKPHTKLSNFMVAPPFCKVLSLRNKYQLLRCMFHSVACRLFHSVEGFVKWRSNQLPKIFEIFLIDRKQRLIMDFYNTTI